MFSIFKQFFSSSNYDIFSHIVQVYYNFTKRPFRIFTVDNVDNFVYKSKMPILSYFYMWITFCSFFLPLFPFCIIARFFLWILYNFFLVNIFFSKRKIQTFSSKEKKGSKKCLLFGTFLSFYQISRFTIRIRKFFWWKEWNGSLRWRWWYLSLQ